MCRCDVAVVESDSKYGQRSVIAKKDELKRRWNKYFESLRNDNDENSHNILLMYGMS